MTDQQLQQFITRHTSDGESERDFLVNKLCAVYRAKKSKPLSHRRVASALDEMYPIERRGKWRVVPRGVAI